MSPRKKKLPTQLPVYTEEMKRRAREAIAKREATHPRELAFADYVDVTFQHFLKLLEREGKLPARLRPWIRRDGS